MLAAHQSLPHHSITIMLILILTISTVSFTGSTFSSPIFTQAEALNSPIVSIRTSTDIHSGKFFGGAVQVVITDTTVDDFDIVEDVEATVFVQNIGGKILDSQTFTIHETSKKAAKFEFYLAHIDSGITVNDIHPSNLAGICTVDLADCSAGADSAAAATLIYFGPGGDFAPTIVQYQAENELFFIMHLDEEVSATYDDTTAQFGADRDTYGQDSIVHLFIDDQDANLNPTVRDRFTISASDIQTLIQLNGGQWGGSVDFVETGRNTARFEALIQLVEHDSVQDNELQWTDDVMQLMLNDMVNYSDSGFDNEENDVANTSDLNLEIDNVDGDIAELGDITFGTELKATIRDNDQNKDSEKNDVISGGLTIETEDGSDSETVNLVETGQNTGIFQPDTINNEIKITFVNSQDEAVPDNTLLELGPDSIGQDIIISYHDPLNDDGEQEDFISVSELTLDILPEVELPDFLDGHGDFELVIKDYNLNDNPRTRDVYTVLLQGSGPYPLRRGADVYDNYALLSTKINGNDATFESPMTLTFTETGINTGRFSTPLNKDDVLANAGLSTADPSQQNSMAVEFQDLFDSAPHYGSDSISLTASTHTALPTIQKLINYIDRIDISDSTASFLKAPLESALTILHDSNPDNDNRVCTKLDNFEGRVTSMLDNDNLTARYATKLHSKADILKDTYGC